MHEETALIATIAGGLGLAFVFGLIAVRLRMPPLVGYLLAGVAVGPFTPGFVADAGLASQLAEIGVILLMFGVGLHFSPEDLWAVRRIAVPGALVQIAAASLLGMFVSHLWGWPWGSGLVFGLVPFRREHRGAPAARSRTAARSRRARDGSRSAG